MSDPGGMRAHPAGPGRILEESRQVLVDSCQVLEECRRVQPDSARVQEEWTQKRARPGGHALEDVADRWVYRFTEGAGGSTLARFRFTGRPSGPTRRTRGSLRKGRRPNSTSFSAWLP